MGSGLVESPRMISGPVSSGNQEDDLITKRDSRLEEKSSLEGETKMIWRSRKTNVGNA